MLLCQQEATQLLSTLLHASCYCHNLKIKYFETLTILKVLKVYESKEPIIEFLAFQKMYGPFQKQLSCKIIIMLKNH